MLKYAPDFNRLRIFYYVYHFQGVKGAAAHVHTSPSAVSQQLAKLESELGVKLFSRPHKRLVPTAAGTALFDTLKPFVVSLESTLSTLKVARDEPAGLVKIGAPVEFGKIFMPRLIAGFRKLFPKVTFYLKIGRTSELLPLVQSGDIDFAFVDTFPAKRRLESEWTGIALHSVFEETVVLACSKQYNEQRLCGDYSYKNMKHQDYIAQQQDAGAIRNWFYHNYKKTCKDVNVVLTVANHQAVVNSIRCDLGLGIIVAQLVSDDIMTGSIHIVETGRRNPVNQVSLMQLMDKVPSPAEKGFQRYVLQELEKPITLKSCFQK